MGQYVVKFENFTPSATNVPAIISAASKRLRILSVTVGGGGASSAAQALVMSRSATGTTPAGGVTPTPQNADGSAAAFTTAASWAVAPAGATNGEMLPYNALGGPYRYAYTGRMQPMEARNGEVICFKPAAGITPQATNLSVLVEED